MTPRTLSTADERRETVLATAAAAFAERGIHGTPTTAVAKAAGISQAYLFRLFPTKEELAVALVDRVNERIHATFAAAAGRAALEGADVKEAMGAAYSELLADRELVLLQLHAHAASSSVPAIRDAMRQGFARLVAFVEEHTDLTPEEIRQFFAYGMLLNVLAAMDADEVADHWADVLVDRECFPER